MFQRTVSLWRRWIGTSQTTETAQAVEEDRRKTPRYPADQQVTYEPCGAGAKSPRPARIQNISRGGVNIVVGHEHHPGDLLSIDLPRADGATPTTVLACVVHVRPEGDNLWSVGCTFARELTPADLAPFRPDAEAGADRRFSERVPCDIQAAYQVVTDPEPRSLPARVLNISTTGIGLLVERTVEPGVLLSVDLCHGGDGHPVTILCCVVHLTEQEDGRWALGCNFITDLPEEEIKALF